MERICILVLRDRWKYGIGPDTNFRMKEEPRSASAACSSGIGLNFRSRYSMIYDRGEEMAQIEKAKVFMSGRSQAVRIPAEFRFSSNEVYIRRDAKNGDVILSQSPGSLQEIFTALDQFGVPDDFLSPSERSQEPPQERSEL